MRSQLMARVLTGIALSVILSATDLGMARGDEGPEEPPIPRTKAMAYYGSLVDAALPAFNSSMLTVANGPDWMAGKTVHQVAVAVQDSDPGTIVTSGPIVMGYDPPDGPRRIKLDFSEGYIRYTNRLRSFHTSSPCVAVSEAVAQSALTATLGALNLPTSEWGGVTIDTVVERGVMGEGQDPPTETVCEIERMVTLDRKASNGYPIFESYARESVSNLNQRARLLIDWPRFVMTTGLTMRTRADVVMEMAQKIWEAESDESGLGAEVDLEVSLGYMWIRQNGWIPVARAVFADIYQAYAGEVLYVPLAYDPSSGLGPEDLPRSLQFRARFDPIGGYVSIDFYLPKADRVRLMVVAVSGREVALLTDADYPSGWHQLEWNTRDQTDRRVPAGVYFARLWVGNEAPTRKILVIR